MMANRPIMTDLAKRAGVSLSTVDRLLNGRESVRPETAERVYRAAQELGYHATNVIRDRARETLPSVDLGLVLLNEAIPFYGDVRAALIKAADARTDYRVSLHFEHVEAQYSHDFSEAICGFRHRVAAVAAVSINHSDVTRAVETLQADGTHVLSLLSDFAQGIRQFYIGSNNLKDGHVIAWMLSKLVNGGKAVVFVGGHRWHGHNLREAGFRSTLRELAPTIECLETVSNFDARTYAYDSLRELLDRHSDLRTVYVASGGRQGAIQAIREMREPGEIELVVHELGDQTVDAMREGYASLILSTDIEKIAADTIDKMLLLHAKGATGVPGQRFHQSIVTLPGMLD